MSKKDSIYKGDWSGINCSCDILDKKESIFKYVQLMFDRTNQMFEYEGLPDTVPAYMLELYLQLNGQVCLTKLKDKIYAIPGGLGGPPDPYYRPTLYVAANPGLGFSASLKILNHLPPYSDIDAQGECVLIRNDTLMEGLLYLFTRYATELAENDISIRSAQINSRALIQITATTDSEAASARAFLQGLEAGKLDITASQPMLNGIKTEKISVQNANTIIQLIELQQYLKASWYNDIGLNANFNMKREYMSEEELQANTDLLLPLVDNMLKCREEGIEWVNQTYGTNINVKKNSSWMNKQRELDTSQEHKEAEIDSLRKEGHDG